VGVLNIGLESSLLGELSAVEAVVLDWHASVDFVREDPSEAMMGTVRHLN